MTPLNRDNALKRLIAASDELGIEPGSNELVNNTLITARRALINLIIVLEIQDPD